MPHAIIRNGPAPSELFEQFSPWKEPAADGSVVEVRCAFLRQDQRVMLIQALAVELGPAQHFFIAIEDKKQLSVRIYSHPIPTRTPAVQRAVVRIAKWVLSFGGEVESTNLEL